MLYDVFSNMNLFPPFPATVTFEKHIKMKDVSQKKKLKDVSFKNHLFPPLCQEESVASQKRHMQLKSVCWRR